MFNKYQGVEGVLYARNNENLFPFLPFYLWRSSCFCVNLCFLCQPDFTWLSQPQFTETHVFYRVGLIEDVWFITILKTNIFVSCFTNDILLKVWGKCLEKFYFNLLDFTLCQYTSEVRDFVSNVIYFTVLTFVCTLECLSRLS